MKYILFFIYKTIYNKITSPIEKAIKKYNNLLYSHYWDDCKLHPKNKIDFEELDKKIYFATGLMPKDTQKDT